jgi:hypothetical protein
MSENITKVPAPSFIKHLTSNKQTTKTSGRKYYFFAVMAIIFPVIAFLGFVPSYMAMNAGQFKIHWLAHVHGALMLAWLVVYLLQAILAVRGNFIYHKKLGLYSVALGILIWISMGVVSARALIGNPTPIDSFLFDILLVQLYIMQVFAIFFTWGLLARKNAEAHKRLIFLATLVLIQAAIDRIPFLQSAFMQYAALDLLLLPLFIYDWITLKHIHKITWIGLLVYIAAQAIVINSFGSPSWHQFWFHFINRFKQG